MSWRANRRHRLERAIIGSLLLKPNQSGVEVAQDLRLVGGTVYPVLWHLRRVGLVEQESRPLTTEEESRLSQYQIRNLPTPHTKYLYRLKSEES